MKNVMDALKSMMGEGKKSEAPEADREQKAPEAAPEAHEETAQMPEDGHLTVKAEYVAAEPETPAKAEPSAQKEVLKDCVLRQFAARRFNFQIEEDTDRVFRAILNIRLGGQLNACRLVVLATGSEIESVAVCPISTAEAYRAAVAEYILRVNCNLKLGGFVQDFNDGEVRYKCTLSAMVGRPSPQDTERVIIMPVLMMEQFGEGLVRCMMGVGNPAEEAEKTRRK